MKYEEKYVIRYIDGAGDVMDTEHPDEAAAIRAFDEAAKNMPSRSRVELRRHMTLTVATAAKA
ncbi:hypothetical protein ABZ128_09335 [Streptomyces sp. NPDC006326]|uniref:hypothetical protein n=1 Tax=Streptomyces sp. NPDC006326 TaxID=3156752 RepID=UPI0033B97303